MIVTCKGCNTSYNLEDGRVKETGSKVRCSICKNIFLAYPPEPIEEQGLPENIEEKEMEFSSLNAEDVSLSDSEAGEAIAEEEKPEDEQVVQPDKEGLPEEKELDFAGLNESLEKEEATSTEVSSEGEDEKLELSDSEFDEAIAEEEKPEIEQDAKIDKEELSIEEELDFADIGESLEMGEVASTDVLPEAGGEKSETSDSEEIDFSELEKMLENGEISFDNLISEETEDKLKFSDTEEIDLSEIDAAIDNFEETDIDEDEDTKELKLEFENDLDTQILKNNKDADELDFSDLENMPDFEESSDSPNDNDKTEEITFSLNLEPDPKTVEQKSGEEEPDELDFSDLEKMLDNETGLEESVVKPTEETGELSLEIDQPPQKELNFEDTVALEGDELDFSDLEKMLDNKDADDLGKELSDEDLELSLETDELTEESKQADYLSTTVSINDMKPHLKPEDADMHKHAQEDGLDDTVIIEDKKIAAAAQESKKDKKVVPPPIKKKSIGKLLLVFVLITALLLGLAAIAFFKPFGIEIPYVSEYIESQIDKNGNLKITPIRPSIKGDFVDTKFGNLFVITGRVKNDYSHPRSNIKVTGEVFNNGALFKAESVYCGNIISNEDLMQIDPAVIKKRLQNRSGDKRSNISVKPGSIIPFMVIIENPSSDLDEFNVNVESSNK